MINKLTFAWMNIYIMRSNDWIRKLWCTKFDFPAEGIYTEHREIKTQIFLEFNSRNPTKNVKASLDLFLSNWITFPLFLVGGEVNDDQFTDGGRCARAKKAPNPYALVHAMRFSFDNRFILLPLHIFPTYLSSISRMPSQRHTPNVTLDDTTPQQSFFFLLFFSDAPRESKIEIRVCLSEIRRVSTTSAWIFVSASREYTSANCEMYVYVYGSTQIPEVDKS